MRMRTVEELVGALGEDEWHNLPRWKRIPSLEAGKQWLCWGLPWAGGKMAAPVRLGRRPECPAVRSAAPGPRVKAGTSRHGAAADSLHPPTHGCAVTLEMSKAGMLPAIWFIFSRRDCDLAARQLELHGVQLTSAEGGRSGGTPGGSLGHGVV